MKESANQFELRFPPYPHFSQSFQALPAKRDLTVYYNTFVNITGIDPQGSEDKREIYLKSGQARMYYLTLAK